MRSSGRWTTEGFVSGWLQAAIAAAVVDHPRAPTSEPGWPEHVLLGEELQLGGFPTGVSSTVVVAGNAVGTRSWPCQPSRSL